MPGGDEALIRLLRERIDLLEERLRQAHEALAPVRSWPAEWRLTKAEGTILSLLLRRTDGLVTREAIHYAVSRDATDCPPSLKVVDVLLCKLRRKMKPLGIRIETAWAIGFRLTPASRHTLMEACRQGGFAPVRAVA